jgi:LmbE family N-acetylglucosaminyl deacetylase
MVFRSRVILAVGAHPDDIELGCGGTLCKAAELGARVIAVFLTRGELSGDAEIRMRESREALKVLGVKDVFFGDFSDSEIPSCRKSIDFLEQFFIKYQPDVVLTHTVNDVHQDHRQAGWLSITAFRNALKVLAYETPRVTPGFTPNYFVDISSCVDSKWTALKCHLSQKVKRYLTYESMVNLASFRGRQVNLAAAEAFEVVRYIEITP